MTDQPAPAPRRFTPAAAIKLVLVAQLAIAGILFFGDIARVLPTLGLRGPDAPGLTRPVLPGDQTRRYDPRRAPGNPDVPETDDLPSRLLFETRGDNLHLTGAIAEGDAQRFADWLSGRTLPDTVVLHSTGGSVIDALEIGRLLRAGKTVTRVDAGNVCLSACPYILAAGTARIVHENGFVGVHQHYFGENTALPAFLAVEDIQRGQAQVMAYLIEMGIDPAIMQHALATPPADIYILLPQELEEYALATELAR